MSKKISQLPQATNLSQDSVLPIVSGSITYKVTLEGLNIVTKTKSEMDILSASDAFIPGQIYKITEVDYALYGGTDIIIKAATTNKLELAGHAIFYNPKYDTGVIGSGIWDITATYSIGDKVFWGGAQWENQTGNIGTAENNYTLSNDWSIIWWYDDPSGYNTVIDSIKYDFENDIIISRQDSHGNLVDCSWEFINNNPSTIKDFQWGNSNSVISNRIIESYLECLNFKGSWCSYNQLTNECYVYSNDFGYNAEFANNILTNYSEIFNNTRYSTSNTYGFDISNNELNNGSKIGNNIFNQLGGSTYNRSNINNNKLNNNSYIGLDNYNSSAPNVLSLSSRIYNNILNNKSKIYSNTLNGGSEIYENQLHAESVIFSNNIGDGGSMYYNIMDGEGYIDRNLITGSYRNRIYLNVCQQYGGISTNTLSGSYDEIYQNSIIAAAIWGNFLCGNYSSIDTNILDANGGRGGFPEFARNKLSGSAFISSNKVFQGGGIEYNSISKGEIFGNFITRDSGIYSNLISGSSGFSYLDQNDISGYSYIRDNDLILGAGVYQNNVHDNSYIQNNKLTGSSYIQVNKIEINSKFAYNNFSESINIQSSSFFSTIVGFGLLSGSKTVSQLHAKNCNLSSSISGSTIIYGNYYKEAFTRQDGATRLGYYNNSDIFTVVNVNS